MSFRIWTNLLSEAPSYWPARPMAAHTVSVYAAKKARGETLAELAASLTARGVATPSGCGEWHPAQVSRVLAYVM